MYKLIFYFYGWVKFLSTAIRIKDFNFDRIVMDSLNRIGHVLKEKKFYFFFWGGGLKCKIDPLSFTFCHFSPLSFCFVISVF